MSIWWQGACVQNVLDSLVPALLADKNRKFIFVEQASSFWCDHVVYSNYVGMIRISMKVVVLVWKKMYWYLSLVVVEFYRCQNYKYIQFISQRDRENVNDKQDLFQLQCPSMEVWRDTLMNCVSRHFSSVGGEIKARQSKVLSSNLSIRVSWSWCKIVSLQKSEQFMPIIWLVEFSVWGCWSNTFLELLLMLSPFQSCWIMLQKWGYMHAWWGGITLHRYDWSDNSWPSVYQRGVWHHT